MLPINCRQRWHYSNASMQQSGCFSYYCYQEPRDLSRDESDSSDLSLELRMRFSMSLTATQNFRAAGFSLDTIFVTGHSHGGSIVEGLVRDELRPNYAGVILFGSYIANNGANGASNDYPIPLLTAVGTLDGRATSYAVREWRESKASNASEDLPVILIEDCTHLQVSSGRQNADRLIG